ncbi:hypothetical protein DKP78_21275 [Enterococcus faecium]|nr:hypothetical protein DKP78_21275 [Enterococcus faecium]
MERAPARARPGGAARGQAAFGVELHDHAGGTPVDQRGQGGDDPVILRVNAAQLELLDLPLAAPGVEHAAAQE